jgi:hypothetical protein
MAVQWHSDCFELDETDQVQRRISVITFFMCLEW